MTKMHMLRKVFIGILALLLTASLLTACGKRGQEDFEKGKAAYDDGHYHLAATYFALAADKGNADAMIQLGECYFHGRGVNEDEKEAIRLFRKLADKGNTEAMLRLAECYYGETEVVERIKWIRKAAKKGNTEAMLQLAICYLNGGVVKKDEKEAVKWIRKAAEKGNANAMSILAGFYYEGRGVKKDEKEAEKWSRKAEEAWQKEQNK